MSKGTVVYDDIILTITDIRLWSGRFYVVAAGEGPTLEYHGPMEMYGPDGVLVQSGGLINVPESRAGQRLRLELALTPDSTEALH